MVGLEESGSLSFVCAEKHKTRENVSIVTDWEVERVGSRAQVIFDGTCILRTELQQLSD